MGYFFVDISPRRLIRNSLDYNLTTSPRISGPSVEKFSPRLEVLPSSQRKLWPELSAVPKEFVLYGGTALALHLGHRDSIDFDFFGNRPLDIAKLETGLSFLAGAK